MYAAGPRPAAVARAGRRGVGRVADAIASPAAGADERSHHRALLKELLDRFPQDELEAVVLSRVDGLNHQEIGEALGISERTVRRLLARIDARIAGWRARREVVA